MARTQKSRRRSIHGATRIVGTGRHLPHLGSGHRLRRPRSMPPARSQPSAVSADAGDDRLVRVGASPLQALPRPSCLLQMGANDRTGSWWLARQPEDRGAPRLDRRAGHQSSVRRHCSSGEPAGMALPWQQMRGVHGIGAPACGRGGFRAVEGGVLQRAYGDSPPTGNAEE